ncbi:MAG: MerR family transcriptional regulator [Hyphomicrobiaceae bacterium]|nr:MerR family transcriptional regulator [Hyphomicrobiaceae bacterium]
MAKSSEAFRNIGEVAVELDVKKHVLRFWEAKFPQVKPMKRGGGRRLYRPSDVELLRGIRDLLQEAGYTIKGVQKILREQGVEYVKTALDAHKRAKDADEQVARATSATTTGASILLDGDQLKALHNVLGELKACRALLSTASKARA